MTGDGAGRQLVVYGRNSRWLPCICVITVRQLNHSNVRKISVYVSEVIVCVSELTVTSVKSQCTYVGEIFALDSVRWRNHSNVSEITISSVESLHWTVHFREITVTSVESLQWTV